MTCSACNWPEGGDWFLQPDGKVIITAAPFIDFFTKPVDLGAVGGGMFGFGILLDRNPGASQVTLVPEPSTALLVASGLAALAVGRRRLH